MSNLKESLYQDRLVRLQQAMKQQGISGFIVTQNVDLYYMTGSMQNGNLFVPVDGEPIFYVRRSISRAVTESVYTVEPIGALKTLQQQLSSASSGSEEQPLVLATEFDVLPVAQFQRLQAMFPAAKWVDGSLIIRELRMIKSPHEIAAIKRAASVVERALASGLRHVRVGMPEFELMAHIEHQLRIQAHAGIMRMRAYNAELITGVVAAGSAAAVPTYFDGPAGGLGLSDASPQSASRRQIQQGEPILLDLGCMIDGYVIDQTRTAVIGTLPEDLQYAYDVAEAVLRATEAKLKPGTPCEELYLDALRQVEDAGLAEHFMGYGENRVKFLGHGIGLEIDELPVLAKGFKYPLESGMVIAIEPKFTFEGRGVVGIENTYLITDDGFEKLSISPEGVAYL
ncbi:aminopeptidase P family protein [Paenibacillus albiflavus]|uniref:Aminopeptidase P family protein n=1 Tax=Paenibacillus albiflavus TaxID=2545760 RepID=A0A4R4E3Z9_9BACL|nr:Xaa-Pro peptidase family protein [Paenibacillus albiflavus]TCZ73410.1 aminopeptidase P family protein [Paenibacillus albiflavus]